MLIWYMLNSVPYITSLDTLEAKTNNISVMNVWLKAITIYKICGFFISKNNVKHLIFIQQLYRHDDDAVHTEVNHMFALFNPGTAGTTTLLQNWFLVIIIFFWALWLRNIHVATWRSPSVRQLQSPFQRRI